MESIRSHSGFTSITHWSDGRQVYWEFKFAEPAGLLLSAVTGDWHNSAALAVDGDMKDIF